MKAKICFSVILFVLFLLVINSYQITRAQEEPIVVPEGENIRADITPLIGYQGRLVINDVPVNGPHSMTFKLFSTQTGGTAEWVETKVVNVTNGLFQTALGDTLPLDASHYTLAKDLWLEVVVGGTTLPRQRLTGAPYALTLAPGALISHNQTYPTMNIENVGTGAALHTNSQSSFSLWGTSLTNAGVYGESISSFGVRAESSGNGLNGSALYAKSLSDSGVAVWAYADSWDAAVVTSNDGTGALLKGFGSDGGEHEFIINNDGSFLQERDATGLVKAAVYAFCGASGSSIERYFNNVLWAGPMTIANAGTGQCVIDFGFEMDQRFFMVTAPAVEGYNQDTFAVCGHFSAYPTSIACWRETYAGVKNNGYIMILVY